MAELVAGNGSHFPVADSGAMVGRHSDDGKFTPDIDLAQFGKTVSRRHAQIFRDVNGWTLRVDPSSRNPTVVAGRTVERGATAALADGDKIDLGSVTLVFRAGRDLPAADPNATIVNARRAGAELRAGDQVIKLATAEGRVLSLGRRSGNYRPVVDLADVPGGRFVSRQHGEITHRDGGWFLLVQGDARNPTYLNGKQLPKGQLLQLTNGDRLRFGRADVTFHVQQTPIESGDLELKLGPPREVVVQPGGQQALPVTLINFSGQVDHFVVAVDGLPSGWSRVELTGSPEGRPDTVQLMNTDPKLPAADATGRGKVVFTPPREPGARAGLYPFMLTATTRGAKPAGRTVPGQLEVLPYADLHLSADEAVLKGARARFPLSVRNAGNEPTSVRLSVAASDKLTCAFDHSDVNLANGGEAGVLLDARVKRRPWFGKQTSHPVSVTASGTNDVAALVLSCPPIVPEWLQTVLQKLQQLFVRPVLVPLITIGILLAMAYLFLRPPDVTIRADPALVGSGAPASVAWKVDRGSGAAVIDITIGQNTTSQQVDQSGSLQIKPDQNANYKVTARNLFGLPGSDSASIKVVRTLSFTAKPDAIKQVGDEVSLEWATENATSVSIVEPALDELKSLPPAGKVVVKPSASTTYKLVAINDLANARSVPAETSVRFGQPNISQFQADRAQVFPGEWVTLSWIADPSNTLTLHADTPDLVITGDQDVTRRTSIQVRPLKSGSYTLTARNPDGATFPATAPVTVVPIRPPKLQGPTKPISAGESTVLSWQVDGVPDKTSIVLQPNVGDVSGKTSIEVRPGHTTEYTLVVTSPDGASVTSEPATVPVLPAVSQFTVVPAVITEGEPVVIRWSVADADVVTVVRDDGFVVAARGQATDDARDHPPATTTSYRLKAQNATGEAVETARSSAPIKVQPAPTPLPPPTIVN
jgi:pSer/pThr/pTyr-binding forkhead associated (FHA) protein